MKKKRRCNELKGRAFLMEGSVVESKPTGPGFGGAWFEATILRRPRNPTSERFRDRLATVEFQTLLADDESGPLVEDVDARLIRPCQMQLQPEQGGFQVGDAVEGLYGEGWWTGEVAEVRDGGRRYWVEFDDPPDAKELRRDRLRPRWDWHWLGSYWVSASGSPGSNAQAVKTKSEEDDTTSEDSRDPSVKLKTEEIIFESSDPGTDVVEKDKPEASDSQERDLAPVSLIAAVPHTQDWPRWNDELYHQSPGKMFTYSRKRRFPDVGSQNAAVPVTLQMKAAGNLPQHVSDEEPDSRIAIVNLVYPAHDATQMPEEVNVQTDCAEQNDIVVRTESLPFSRSSPVWEAVDSHKAFLRFPQHPHFRPLSSYNDFTREGMAVAAMFNFASTVEKILKFQITDPLSSFEESLEILLDLEPHGFNIKLIENYLGKMLKIKESYDKLRGGLERMTNGLSELSHENAKINDEIGKLRAKMEENMARMFTMKKSMDAIDAMIMTEKRKWPQAPGHC